VERQWNLAERLRVPNIAVHQFTEWDATRLHFKLNSELNSTIKNSSSHSVLSRNLRCSDEGLKESRFVSKWSNCPLTTEGFKFLRESFSGAVGIATGEGMFAVAYKPNTRIKVKVKDFAIIFSRLTSTTLLKFHARVSIENW
jgi:hypothetical protein